MATQEYSGAIAAWKDDRGFGFIRTESNNKEDDVFIHISSLNNMSRRPRVGDVIHYDLIEENGKIKASNAIIEGVEPFHDTSKKCHTFLIIIVTAIISSAATYALMTYPL
ncbi:MAG: cold shock domain-containing protein [Gammaproteobacteria bacterium]|nr:MAG: cold shock domain-containing protein [Gammaproteobacteria bacterium]